MLILCTFSESVILFARNYRQTSHIGQKHEAARPSTPGWYGNEVAAFEQFAQFWPWQQQQHQQAQFNAAGGPFGYRGFQPTQPLLPPPLQQFIGWPQWANRPITAGNSHWGATSSQPGQLPTPATPAASVQPSSDTATVTPQDEDDELDTDVHDSRLTRAEAALADTLVRIFGKEARFKKVRRPGW